MPQHPERCVVSIHNNAYKLGVLLAQGLCGGGSVHGSIVIPIPSASPRATKHSVGMRRIARAIVKRPCVPPRILGG